MYQVVFLYLNILSIIEKLSTIENTLVRLYILEKYRIARCIDCSSGPRSPGQQGLNALYVVQKYGILVY